MKQYTVTGMSCAACSARVEKAVSEVPGVTSCAVSLLTNSMGVEGTAAPQEIIRAVENAGYGAAEKKRGGAETAGAAEAMPQEGMLKDRETPLLKKRLVASVGFLAVLMYFSMGHMMWGWPLPSFFEGNHAAMGLLQLLLTAAVCLVCSMNDMAVPSVSLEGKTLWISRSLPVDAWTALRAKCGVQLLLTAPGAVFAAVCSAIALRAPFVTGLLMVLCCAVFVFFSTYFALYIGFSIV